MRVTRRRKAAAGPIALGNDAAPADFDAGDHVNLTSDGYSTISKAYDLASLGPDA